MPLRLDLVSDVICPWCYVGKRRVERALAELGGEQTVTVVWHPFELNPDMPREGMARRDYRTRKFGSWERSQELDRRIAEVGAAEGIPFAHARMECTPNTLDAHRLLWLAREQDLQNELVERLFRAYFVEGIDIGDRARLAELAEAAGLDRGAVEAFLRGGAGVEEVRREEEQFRALGISGVPFVIINGMVAVSGAQPAEVFTAAFRQALGEGAPDGSAPVAAEAPAEGCALDDPGKG